MNFEQKIDKYAKLTVETGMNIKKGENVFIRVRAGFAAEDFVAQVIKHLYKNGAKHIDVDWHKIASNSSPFVLLFIVVYCLYDVV